VHRRRLGVNIGNCLVNVDSTRQLGGDKAPARVPRGIDPGPEGPGVFNPGRCRSLLQLAFQRLDFGRKRVIGSYQRFDLADCMQDRRMVPSAKAAADFRQGT